MTKPGQQPIAAVLWCADSRVPPEIIFDQGLGEIFVVRLAGNISEPFALGSIDYAVASLHVSLIVVLGHEQCGAVAAALVKSKPAGISANSSAKSTSARTFRETRRRRSPPRCRRRAASGQIADRAQRCDPGTR